MTAHNTKKKVSCDIGQPSAQILLPGRRQKSEVRVMIIPIVYPEVFTRPQSRVCKPKQRLAAVVLN